MAVMAESKGFSVFPEGTLVERQKVLCYAQESKMSMHTNRALSMADWPVVWRK